MKNFYIIAILLIIVVVVILLNVISHKFDNHKSISDIRHFSFSYTMGYAMNARVRYEIDYKDNYYNLVIVPNGIADEDTLEIKIDKEIINKVKDVLVKYNVSKWNGFDKVDKNVLDGNSFSFYLKTDSDVVVEASGYMKWPDNYGKVKEELNNIFMDIYDKNRGKRVE